MSSTSTSGSFGGSALTDNIERSPRGRGPTDIAADIPVTYVPARKHESSCPSALAFAETLGAQDIFIASTASITSGYPDCRPEYIAAFERMANLATKAGGGGKSFRIHAPLIAMTKAEIIRTGARLGVDYSLTTTCYDPSDDGKACGRCDACLLRLEGFRQAGMEDPVPYTCKG